MKSEPVRALSRVPGAASSRSLTTARSVLRVLSLLIERPSGVRADEVAQALGKSVSTAYYLLSSLCEEGFAVHESKGVYRPARGLEELTSAGEEAVALHDGVEGAVDELFALTRKRSYLGVVRAGRIEIVAFHGRQGVPRMPGLGSEIRDSAHALAMGKVVLSLLGPRPMTHYVARGLKSFTPQTITDPARLRADLDGVRRRGFAVDREEFQENFCCIAAPIVDQGGRFVAALGLSTTRHGFDSEGDTLAQAVVGVARAATPAAADRPQGARASNGHRRLESVRPLASSCENPELLERGRSETYARHRGRPAGPTHAGATREPKQGVIGEQSQHHQGSQQDPGAFLGADLRHPGREVLD